MAEHPFRAYLDAQPEPQRTTLETTAARLRSLLPGAAECISYGMPAFKVDGTAIAGLAGFTRHCSYFPHSGATLGRIAEHLAGYDFDEGTLRFPVDTPLPRDLLRKLVAARLAVESEHPPRAGKVREFFDNGRLRCKGGARDGQPHGDWAWYRRDGSLLRAGRYRAGVKTGTWRTFDRDGALTDETTC